MHHLPSNLVSSLGLPEWLKPNQLLIARLLSKKTSQDLLLNLGFTKPLVFAPSPLSSPDFYVSLHSTWVCAAREILDYAAYVTSITCSVVCRMLAAVPTYMLQSKHYGSSLPDARKITLQFTHIMSMYGIREVFKAFYLAMHPMMCSLRVCASGGVWHQNSPSWHPVSQVHIKKWWGVSWISASPHTFPQLSSMCARAMSILWPTFVTHSEH